MNKALIEDAFYRDRCEIIAKIKKQLRVLTRLTNALFPSGEFDGKIQSIQEEINKLDYQFKCRCDEVLPSPK